jgi:uncharacterized membrane protein YcaP (DUF421 family)
MRRNNLSKHDLIEDLRLNGNVRDPRKVTEAYFERNGQISVVLGGAGSGREDEATIVKA